MNIRLSSGLLVFSPPFSVERSLSGTPFASLVAIESSLMLLAWLTAAERNVDFSDQTPVESDVVNRQNLFDLMRNAKIEPWLSEIYPVNILGSGSSSSMCRTLRAAMV